jgi:hypothetical protein
VSIFTRQKAHTLQTSDAVVAEADIEAAYQRRDRVRTTLNPIPAELLPDERRDALLTLAWLGYEVKVYESADPDVLWIIWLPAAQDFNIIKPNGYPVVWSGRISLADWREYGPRLHSALLSVHAAKGVA